MTPKLESFLRSWHRTSGQTQRDNGKQFDLSFDDFLGLWSKSQLRNAERWCADGSLYLRLNSDSERAYVLSWVSYAASQGPVMNRHTAQICTRKQSAQACLPQKGDTLGERHKARISKKLTGQSKSEKHRANISASMQGVHKGRKGDATESANKSAGASARWARFRAEREALARKEQGQ